MKISKYKFSSKAVQQEHDDTCGQTDMTKTMGVVRDYAITPKHNTHSYGMTEWHALNFSIKGQLQPYVYQIINYFHFFFFLMFR